MAKRVSTQDLVVLVNERKIPLDEVASMVGMSRQGIWKRLKAAGVYVARALPGGAPSKCMKRPCGFCGVLVQRYRKRVLNQDQMNFYCSQECYAASLEQHTFEEWRHGSRLARAIVSQHFNLQPEHVVHHKDGSQKNNDLDNLLVFANQSDHISHHRGRKVIPLFDGVTVQREKNITESFKTAHAFRI